MNICLWYFLFTMVHVPFVLLMAIGTNLLCCVLLTSSISLYRFTKRNVKCFQFCIIKVPGRIRWPRGSVLAFSTQVCGFKTGRSRRIFRAKKILSMPTFGGEVKPSVSCRRFAACKRSLHLRGSRNLGKITTGHLSCPQFHLSLLGSLASLRTEAHGS